MHGFSTLDYDKPRDPAKLIATSKQMADFLRARNPNVELYLMATWSRADQTYPREGAWAGEPIEAMARDVRAAYDRAAKLCGSQDGDPRRRGVDARHPDRRRRSESLRRHRAGQARSLGPRPLSRQRVRELPRGAGVIFGSVTGRDPRSLGENECSAYELGFRPCAGQSASAGCVRPAGDCRHGRGVTGRRTYQPRALSLTSSVPTFSPRSSRSRSLAIEEESMRRCVGALRSRGSLPLSLKLRRDLTEAPPARRRELPLVRDVHEIACN